MLHLIGIDWSEEHHTVCILNEEGKHLALFNIDHNLAGFQRLEAERQKLAVPAGECLVALETAHNLLVDFLWNHHYVVYVIPPKAVNRYRDRRRQSGAKDDRSDALTLAEILRTDRAAHQVWEPDLPLTRQIRAKVDLAITLERTIQRQTNQLRSVLLRYYPQAVGLFSGLDTQIGLAFIMAYPIPQAALSLSWQGFQEFAKAHDYTQTKELPKVYARLRTFGLATDVAIANIYQDQAKTMARLTLSLVQARLQVMRELREIYGWHEDAKIYDSLPGAGELLEPALLSMFGDRREHYPSPAILQAIAGTCPVTEQSGKKRYIHFRKACNKDLRWMISQYARSSLTQSSWAAAYWEEVRSHCDSDAHAYRCLANRWIAIIWKLWQTKTTYDEALHMHNRELRRQPRPQN